jgi:glutamate/tyrosine decarboxylase-like PLP-dependent enzyme
LKHADSITIDFHKMGRGHYPSSAFIVNRREDLKYLARSVSDTPYFSDASASRDPALFTLECSRPGLGPYTVMASLDGIGLNGWRMLVARSLELAEYFKERLSRLSYCRVLNRHTPGAAVNWWVLPKGRNADEIFDRLVAGQLSQPELNRYFTEIRRSYERREASADPVQDARLGFTTDYGFNPHGLSIPAWKAVFFNPKTDQAIIDRIIYSLEELA